MINIGTMCFASDDIEDFENLGNGPTHPLTLEANPMSHVSLIHGMLSYQQATWGNEEK